MIPDAAASRAAVAKMVTSIPLSALNRGLYGLWKLSWKCWHTVITEVLRTSGPRERTYDAFGSSLMHKDEGGIPFDEYLSGLSQFLEASAASVLIHT